MLPRSMLLVGSLHVISALGCTSARGLLLALACVSRVRRGETMSRSVAFGVVALHEQSIPLLL